MPPKKAGKNIQKNSKANGQLVDLDVVGEQAQKMFLEHEKKRVSDEEIDNRTRNRKLMQDIITKERLFKEKDAMVAFRSKFAEEERLVFMEFEKHATWKHLSDASTLPDVQKENEINTFLSLWSDSEIPYDKPVPETIVIVSQNSSGGPRHKHFIRGEQSLSSSKWQKFISQELLQCLKAYEVTEAIKVARDRAIFKGNLNEIAFHNLNLTKVYRRMMEALDFTTITALRYYDKIIEDNSSETLTYSIPEINTVLKYGLWIKIKNTTRTFNTLVYPQIDISLDPKINTVPKLPKALGLSKENVAVRVIQFAFDPYDGQTNTSREFYALACTLKVSLLDFFERPRQQDKWYVRSETSDSHILHEQPYPPMTTEARIEETALTISFDVPSTLIVRQPTLLIGKWVSESCEWELCTHATFGPPFSGATRAELNPRRATFVTNELSHFAVLQKRTFDAPYALWNLQPISYDRVVLTLQGRYRGEASDREFVILVEDAACKLLTPDDVELERLRSTWLEPATLFRELYKAGFNFMLEDSDADFIENLKPKSRVLEAKAYADISQFCQYYIFANTKHNKDGEDVDMALFRMSKKYRAVDEERKLFQSLDTADESWHSVRYHSNSCVLCAFKESDNTANLNALDGCDPHFDLYTMLLPVEGEDTLRNHFSNTNYLLRRCVFQILSITRLLTWG